MLTTFGSLLWQVVFSIQYLIPLESYSYVIWSAIQSGTSLIASIITSTIKPVGGDQEGLKKPLLPQPPDPADFNEQHQLESVQQIRVWGTEPIRSRSDLRSFSYIQTITTESEEMNRFYSLICPLMGLHWMPGLVYAGFAGLVNLVVMPCYLIFNSEVTHDFGLVVIISFLQVCACAKLYPIYRSYISFSNWLYTPSKYIYTHNITRIWF